MRLASLGPIETIKGTWEATSEDTCKEVLVINSKKFSWSALDYLEPIALRFPRCITRLKPEYKKQVEDYLHWESKNKKELAEYERLKKKFGGGCDD